MKPIHYLVGGKYANKWKTFEHNGVSFPPEYTPHKIPIIYQGEEIILNKLAEEYGTIYAKYTDTEYINNKIFRKNFWHDWKKILGSEPKIKNLDDCNFSKIYQHILDQKGEKKNLSKEEKEKIKKKTKEQDKKFTIAVVDGVEQPVGNFRIEPPGIFIGRGCHPKLGKLKKRIYPEQITLNIGKEAKIPDTIKDHQWGKIIHDKNVEWLASWRENVTGKIKYVWLASHSAVKGLNDKQKFDLARKLKKKVKSIRTINELNMTSDDQTIRQIATALYFIDFLALRVGNEKREEEADTVGVTSLRIEHIKLGDDNHITLDFLGKDSVRYKNKFKVSNEVYKNLTKFAKDKEKQDNLFDKINPTVMNKYLQSFMKDLTSKVFRTYRASSIFQKELKKIDKKIDESEGDDKIKLLLDVYNRANTKVAKLCNHQKKVNKSFDTQLQKIEHQIKSIKNNIRKKKATKSKSRSKSVESLKMKLKKMKSKKELKLELKNISLGTSKINYIDPRISVTFTKKHKIPLDLIFNKTLQEKFRWAMEVDQNYKF